MDFSIPPDLQTLKDEIDAFVSQRSHSVRERSALGRARTVGRDAARPQCQGQGGGLLGVHVPKEFGGRGLDHFGKAIAFEAAGYSMLGPMALHCHAPDEGNIHLMDVVGTPAQKEKYLRPLADRRDPLVLRHDRAATAAPAPIPALLKTRRDARRQRLRHQRPQVADHRRRWRCASPSSWRAPATGPPTRPCS